MDHLREPTCGRNRSTAGIWILFAIAFTGVLVWIASERAKNIERWRLVTQRRYGRMFRANVRDFRDFARELAHRQPDDAAFALWKGATDFEQFFMSEKITVDSLSISLIEPKQAAKFVAVKAVTALHYSSLPSGPRDVFLLVHKPERRDPYVLFHYIEIDMGGPVQCFRNMYLSWLPDRFYSSSANCRCDGERSLDFVFMHFECLEQTLSESEVWTCYSLDDSAYYPEELE